MKNKLCYMCPVTRTHYDNFIEPRLNYLYQQDDLTPDEILEYYTLCKQLKQQRVEKDLRKHIVQALSEKAQK